MQLALGVVGGVAGSFFGMPQVGFMLGSALGGILFPEKSSNTEGPRLSDLSSTTCQYGTYKGIVYGTVRRSGNVFWSTKKKEHKKKISAGKAGGGASSTQYTYTQSFALGLSESEILGINKIWFNNTLVYESSSTSNLGTVVASSGVKSSFTVYKGTEEQMPDPTIESEEGVENTPAYRGLAYIVFKDLDITSYGSVPNILVEVVGKNGGVEIVGKILEENTNSYFTDSLGSIGSNVRINMLLNYPSYNVTSGLNGTVGAFPSLKNISNNIAKIINHKLNYRNSFINNDYINNKSFYVNFNENISYNFSDKDINDVISTPPVFLEDRTDRQQYCFVPLGNLNNSNSLYINTMNLLNPITHSMSVYESPLVVLSYFATDATGEFTLENIVDKLPEGRFVVGATMSYDNTEAIVFTSEDNILVSNEQAVIYYDKFARSGSVITKTESGIFDTQNTAPGFNEGFTSTTKKCAFEGNIIYKIESTGISGIRIYLYEIVTNQVKLRNTFTISNLSFNSLFYAAKNQILYLSSEGFTAVLSSNPYIVPSTVSLSDVIQDQFNYVNIFSDRTDLSELDDSQVHGYLISNRSSARANIETLCNAYFFDITESNGILKARKRGHVSAGTIYSEEMGATEGSDVSGANDITIEHLDELNLPKKVEVSYWSKDEGLEVRTQIDIRETVYAIDTKTYQIPVVLTNDQAQAAATVLLYNDWNERDKFTFSTTMKYMQFEPADVITIVNDKGNSYNVRIMKKDIGQNGIINWEATTETQNIYTQNKSGASSLNPETSIKQIENTRILPMNLPIINNNQPDVNAYYIAVAPFSDEGRWNGAVTLKTLDNKTFTYIEEATFDSQSDTVFGNCLNKLGSYNEDNTLDTYNYLDVLLNIDEEISSYTFNDLLERQVNYALVGNELIQFMNVQQLDNKKYRLSNFLRGRNGTERFINSHVDAETLILLDMTKIAVVQDSVSNIDVTYGLSAISTGLTDLSNGFQVSFAQDGSPIKPLSPAHYIAIQQISGYFDFNWVRRARLNSGWSNNIDVPLDEISEDYIIEIYDSTYTTLLNTYNVSRATTFRYTLDMQNSDYGSSVSNVYSKIYQVSNRAGKGFSATIKNVN